MSANFSDCQQYRYWLRRGSEANALLFIMLNPSTADSVEDDPTIRRCSGFAESNGYSGIVVANLYAYRATKSRQLWLADDPVGPENDYFLEQLVQQQSDIVCAWGGKAKPERVARFAEIVNHQDSQLLCLGTTNSGAPKHPLYVKGEQPLVSYRVKQLLIQ
jgi:hypothetical protein